MEATSVVFIASSVIKYSLFYRALTNAASVTIFEFLAAPAWTWVVRPWHFIANNRLMLLRLAAAGILISGRTLGLIGVIEVSFLLVVALLMLFGSRLSYLLLLLYGKLDTH